MISVQKVEEIFEEYPSHLTHKIKGNYKDSYKYIKENFGGDKFTEKVYQYAYGENEAICELNGCNKECKFQKFGEGYTKYCSYDCSGKAKEKEVENECEMCGDKFITVPSRSRDYCSKECRREYFKTEECNKKRVESHKKTVREKYGTEYYFQTDEFKEKAKKTTKERYGDENYRNVEKAKKTKKERYGDPNYNNMKKHIKTINRKYNSDSEGKIKNISQTIEYKNKLKKNQIRRIDKKLPNHIERNFEDDEYKGVQNLNGSIKYRFYCSKCDESFEDILNAGNIPICPNCDKLSKTVSKKEKEVLDYIKGILPENVELVENNTTVLGGKELDIYIPEKSVAIEFDGLYWHSEKSGGKSKNYHLDKTEKCEERNIQLIHLFENEWEVKREKVKKRLGHILNCSEKDHIYARKCHVEKIDNDKKEEFLEKHHLKGSSRSKVKLGLFSSDDLVSVMTFGTPNISQGHDNKNFWEIKRYSSSKVVVGGVGKLFSYFIDNYDPEKVITYADRRWSTKLSNVYEKIGFEFIKKTSPSYFYFLDNPFNLHHRFNFRKDLLCEKLNEFNSELTEWENMQKNGYDRIWDCGHLKYEWNKK